MVGGKPMTRDELFKLASESGMLLKRRFVEGNEKFTGDCLERFAALVAAHEREACAKVCDDLAADAVSALVYPFDFERCADAMCAKVCEQKSPVKGGEVFAARIRARGENP
jgi:hypothetical protein